MGETFKSEVPENGYGSVVCLDDGLGGEGGGDLET